MMGKSHVVFGVGTYLAVGQSVSSIDDVNNRFVSFVFDYERYIPFMIDIIEKLQMDFLWMLFIPIALIGSLTPDIDHHKSLIKKNIIIKIISFPFTLLGHRTWSHSILALIGLFFVITLIPNNEYLYLAWFAFIIGYASHIIGDWFTPSGVPLLFPLGFKFRSPLNFKTGSFIETPVSFIPFLIYILMILKIV